VKRLALLVYRVRKAPPLVADGALAAGFLTFGLLDYRAYFLSGLSEGTGGGGPRGGAIAITFLVLATTCLTFRRRWPLPVFFLAASIWGLLPIFHVWVDYAQGFGLSVAEYTVVAAYHRRWQSWLALVTVVAADLGGVAQYGAPYGLLTFAVSFAQDEFETVLVFVAGRIEGSRRAVSASLIERGRLIEEERDRLAALAVAGERMRIARELHGLVVDEVQTMARLAGEAAAVLDRGASAAADAIGAIASAGRRALGEMRRLLGVLRREESAPLARSNTVGLTTATSHGVEPANLAAPRWLSRIPRAGGLLLLVAAGVEAAEIVTRDDRVSARSYGPVALLLGLAIPLALVWRRRAPFTVLMAVAMAAALQGILRTPAYGIDYYLSLVAVYAVGEGSDDWRVPAGAVIGTIAYLPQVLKDGEGLLAMPSFFVLAAFAAYIGRSARLKRLANEELERRNTLLAELREERIRMVVVEERNRVARDMHDVVAHGVSVMVVQAEAASRVAERSSARARDALVAVERMGAEALAELDELVGILGREPDHGETRSREARTLEALVREAADSGLDVELASRGEARIPASVELSLFRIVQEALTNVRRHAAGAHTLVDVRRAPDAVDVEVVNEPAAPPDSDLDLPGVGLGLLGMRERVAAFGGTLLAGSTPSGGFLVQARLCYDPEPR
jgi:signal transduction histidine kinase